MSENKIKVEIEVSTANEMTAAPWWAIIDPRQNFHTDRSRGVDNIASMVRGPFFSRKEAEDVLEATHYHYSKNARVYCMSGSDTIQYAGKVKF